MGNALKTLFTSKRNIIMVLTGVFNLVLAIAAAVGHSMDPAQAAAVWDPIILATATLVTFIATQVIKSYGQRDPGQPPAGILLVFLVFGLGGCMHALRPHAEDHYVQTQVIADKCKATTEANGYPESPCSEELQAQLDEMAKQAACIHATTKGEKCGDQ